MAESQRLMQGYRHSQWDVEHVFLALDQQEKGLTGDVFKQLGVDGKLVAARVEQVLRAAPKIANASANV